MSNLRRLVFFKIFVLSALMMFPLPALADPFQGGAITIDLPEGWTAAYDAEIHQIMAESADKTCRVALQVADADGMNDQQLAEMLSNELKGGTPQKVPGFDNYYFTANVNNMEMTISLFEFGGKVLVYIEGGETRKYERDTIRIWNSMTSADPAEKALFDSVTKS